MTALQAAFEEELTKQVDVLAANLEILGFVVRPVPRGRFPGVKVMNPKVRYFSETVFAAGSRDGTAWFWWSWGEPIDRIGNEPAVAARIASVLAGPEAS